MNAAGSHSKKTAAPPPWWQDAVFYQIMVDRFRRPGHARPLRDPALPVFCGGNLRGVIEALDYLRRLDVDALWLSPIQCTASYHGYHITDFERVDRRFGGMVSFRALLKEAKPDFRIMMDWVPNHVHCSHPFFIEAQRSKRSRYRDWFYFDRQGDHLSFLDFGELPKLNLDHPAARDYVINCALQWLDLGVDGFRLDHVIGPSMGFWRAFRKAVKQKNPSAYLLGEAWFDGIARKDLKTVRVPHKHRHFQHIVRGVCVADDVMQEYIGVLDGALDFGFQRILSAEVARARRAPAKRTVQTRLDKHYAGFPEDFSLPSFLDNHDMNRFLYAAGGRQARLRLAAEIQFRQVQPPIIYYGTEVGMGPPGTNAHPHADLMSRQMMPWHHRQTELLEFYTDLIRRRRARR